MNAQQPQPRSQGREPAAPPPSSVEYRLSQDVNIADEAVYQACHRLRVWVSQKCKNNCDKCLYRNSFRICIKDIAPEIMKNIERKYGVDEEIRTND